MLTRTRRARLERRGATRRWIALAVCLAVLFTGVAHIAHAQAAAQHMATATHQLDGDAPSGHAGADHGYGKYCPTGMGHDFYLPHATALGPVTHVLVVYSSAGHYGGGISAPPQIGPPRASV